MVDRAVAISGPTRASLAALIDEYLSHSQIDNLYLRFEIDPLRADLQPNKLRKANYLIGEVGQRADGHLTLPDLIAHLSTSGHTAFRRCNRLSKDLYDNFDRDLAGHHSTDQPSTILNVEPQRTFARPGTTAPPKAAASTPTKRYVFVIRGRDSAAFLALTAFLTALDLRVITWNEASARVGGGSPHTLDIVEAGIGMADAVIALFTPDDLGRVKDEFFIPRDHPQEAALSGQARQNVVFEAGWAMARNRGNVILVRVGDIRGISDIDGLNYVWLTGDISSRRQLMQRLGSLNLAVNDTGEEWRSAGTFPGQP